MLQQAANVMLACVNAMLPHDTYGNQQESELAALAADASLKSKVVTAGDIPDGYRAVLRMAYGLMQVGCATAAAPAC